jgi:hypothetical protein
LKKLEITGDLRDVLVNLFNKAEVYRQRCIKIGQVVFFKMFSEEVLGLPEWQCGE